MTEEALNIIRSPGWDCLSTYSSGGYTALHVAAFLDFPDVCAEILARGGDQLASVRNIPPMVMESSVPLRSADFPVGTTPLEIARPLECAVLMCLSRC